ncbi:MAG: hypothetical protein PHV97_00835 [Candidatus Omnitrophica bacterium]|nr:hypothetical protein [Candidatus Omnitrophota bacterium]
MKLPESLFSRMLLAYLPFMIYPYGFLKTGVAALWIVTFLWLTVAFFWFTRRLFPDRSIKGAFFLWLIVWAQAVWTLTKLPPYWIVSIFFLAPVSFLEDTAKASHVRVFSKKVPRYFFERALAGIGFAGFVMMMSLVREIGEKRLGIQAFEQPAGMLLVIAAAAFLWKNQPYGKR